MSLHAYYCRLPARTVGMSTDPPAPGEHYAPCGIYVAATRGRAKMLLLRDDQGIDLDEFVDVRTNCVERHVDALLDIEDGEFVFSAMPGPLREPRHDPPGETEAERLYYRCWGRVHEIEDHAGRACDCPELVWDDEAQDWKAAA